jgi:DNA polymerase III epsilon subunit family exonuclease
MARGSLKDQIFIALDLETTGLSAVRDRILEVAAVRFSLAEGVLGTFSQLVNPQSIIPAAVIRIHGITAPMVAEAPLFSSLIPALEEFWQGGILLAHNASFDLAFLACELRRAGHAYPLHPTIDTCRLARLLLPEAPNYKLSTLTAHFELPTDGPAHRALPDSQACAELFRLCVTRLPLQAETQLESFWQNYPGVRNDVLEAAVATNHPLTPPLNIAIEKQLDVKIFYHNARNERTERIVTPLFLAGRGTFTYLEAFCHLRQENRQFRLDRMQYLGSI